MWHLDGTERLQRNAIMRGVDPAEYAFTDWVYGPTALFPDEEPPMFRPVPLTSARIEESEAAAPDAALAGGTAR